MSINASDSFWKALDLLSREEIEAILSQLPDDIKVAVLDALRTSWKSQEWGNVWNFWQMPIPQGTSIVSGDWDQQTNQLPALIPTQTSLLDAEVLTWSIEWFENLQDNVKKYLKRIITEFLAKLGNPEDFFIENIKHHIIQNKLTNKKAQDYVKALILRLQDALLYLVSELKDLERKNYNIGIQVQQGERNITHRWLEKPEFGLLAIPRDFAWINKWYKQLCEKNDWENGKSKFLYCWFDELLQWHERTRFTPINITWYNDRVNKWELPTFNISISGADTVFTWANKVYWKMFEGIIKILDQLHISPDLILAYEETDEYKEILAQIAISQL